MPRVLWADGLGRVMVYNDEYGVSTITQWEMDMFRASPPPGTVPRSKLPVPPPPAYFRWAAAWEKWTAKDSTVSS